MLVLSRHLSNQERQTLDAMLTFEQPPRIVFPAEQTRCAACHEPLKSYKTTEERLVVTLAHGPFHAVESVRYCPTHQHLGQDSSPATTRPHAESPSATGAGQPRVVAYRSHKLRSIVGPKRKYGYELVAHVGGGGTSSTVATRRRLDGSSPNRRMVSTSRLAPWIGFWISTSGS